MISFTYNKCRRFLCGIPKIHIQIIPATNWQHIFATNLQPRFRKLQCFRAFPTFFSYSNSFSSLIFHINLLLLRFKNRIILIRFCILLMWFQNSCTQIVPIYIKKYIYIFIYCSIMLISI